jgi:hypothetical protein
MTSPMFAQCPVISEYSTARRSESPNPSNIPHFRKVMHVMADATPPGFGYTVVCTIHK